MTFLRLPRGLAVVLLALVLVGRGGVPQAQSADEASLLLEAAIEKQLSADFKGAIAQFQTILARFASQHQVAAQALWRMGQAQEQLGLVDDARQSYRRLVRDYSGELKAVAAAGRRLALLAEDEEWGDRELTREIITDPSLRPSSALAARAGGNPRLTIFSDISVYDFSSKEVRRLTTAARSAAYPVLSPRLDIAYLSWNGDLGENLARQQAGYADNRSPVELRVVNVNGTHDRVLVSGRGIKWLRPYEWSPDGSAVAAIFERTSGVRELALVALEGGRVDVMKRSARLSAQDMSFSPDGRFLAYQAPTPASAREFDLVVLPVIGSASGTPERRYLLSQAGRRGVPATSDELAVHVLNRIGFGPRPGDVQRVKAIGIDEYIAQQLHPESVPDPWVDAKVAGFPSFKMDIPELLEKGGPVVAIAGRRRATIFERPDMLARERAQGAPAADPRAVASAEPKIIRADDAPAGFELRAARLLRAVHSERQLQEVMVDFWMNHFNVNLGDHQLASHFEELAIRRHALGRFEDILFAAAKHPRMLYYLDNWRSSAPAEVIAARVAEKAATGDVDTRVALLERAPFLKETKGLNENFARELLELHTLGVDGGYNQADILNVAKILTGWTIGSKGLVNAREDDGVFAFDPVMHVDGDKVVMGQTIKGGGVEEGEQLLRMLAHHPSTAKFISTKLARRFIADEPPPAVVASATQTFLRTGGDLREVVRTILMSPQFRSGETLRVKIKKPFELVASALRAVDASFEDLDVYDALIGGRQGPIARMGEQLYEHEAPDGNPDVGPAWMNSNALLLRLDFANRLATGRVRGVTANLAAAQIVLSQIGIPRPTPTQLQQTRAMLQSNTALAAPAPGGPPAMLATAAGGTGSAAPLDPAAVTVAAMLGSPQFQKR